MASRDLMLLHPVLRDKARAFLVACEAAGHPALITCTGRTYLEQAALHAQGRKPLSVVNEARLLADLAPISAAQNRKITWTMSSKHLIDPATGFCSAFDFCLLNGKAAHWDIKVSLDGDEIPDYHEAGLIALELGLTWGGTWKTPDFPHCQLEV